MQTRNFNTIKRSALASALLTAVIGVLCLFRGSGLEKAEEPSL